MPEALPPRDDDGYLLNLDDWSPVIADQLAREENIELTEAHWEILRLVKQFYREFELSPASRALVNYVKQNLGADKGRSIYLLKLFPPHPALMVNKIAGLPRPANCF